MLILLVLLALHNDNPPSEAHFNAIRKDSLLDRLEFSIPREPQGTRRTRSARNKLIRIGMEIDDATTSPKADMACSI